MELDFWKIPEELIGECCWREFQNGIDRMKVVHAISATLTDRFDDPEVREQLTRAGRVWLTMERPDYGKRAKIWCAVYYICILLSTITFMMLTLNDFQEVKPEFESRLEEYTNDNDTLHVVHYGTFHKPVDWLEGTEICLDIFFTLEFAIRLITCPDKKDFVRNKHNIVDIMILSTAWTRCIYDRIITWDHENFTEARSFAMVVLNSLLGLRVLRMLHLAKIFRTLKVMYLSILASMQELALLVVVMGAGVLLFGSTLYIAEGFSTSDNEPLQFASIPEAMWWAIITMTTVGYGDYYPVHAAGYVVGAICAVSGLLLVAMPIAIVASNFSLFYDNMSSRDQSLRRQAMLGQMIGIAMANRGAIGSENGSQETATDAAVDITGSDPAMPEEELDRSDPAIRKRHASSGKKDVPGKDSEEVPTDPAQTVFLDSGMSTGNGHVKSSSKEMIQKRDTGDSYDSRKEKHVQKHQSSSATRREPSIHNRHHLKDDNAGENNTNLNDGVRYHKSRHIGDELSLSRVRDTGPLTVGYVGVRADGKAKDQPESRHGPNTSGLRPGDKYSSDISGNYDRKRSSKNSSNPGQLAGQDLSPVD
ncbi:potassium voltage-gated channel subfamily B member 2 [Elysia marginata]|uniref:Potassium voltage-gated channel subfamily B member 2 n=1 Tax=Elysia marginata TaxID=1093978 RepID=A0AAV4FP88_9GAST|nr:potassium voltage-gated channel subfamily B member 2 [Elysia marginata]